MKDMGVNVDDLRPFECFRSEIIRSYNLFRRKGAGAGVRKLKALTTRLSKNTI
jgi:hypothetical protein